MNPHAFLSAPGRQRAPGGTKGGATPEGGGVRWDWLSEKERRAWSSELAAREAREQRLPIVASPAQHRKIAAIFATRNRAGRAYGAPERLERSGTPTHPQAAGY